jgi:diguanylate cyclase (GGDEF)-like protein
MFPSFVVSSDARVALWSLIIAGYAWGTAYEFWRGREEPLMSRWPAILLLALQGGIMLARIPMTFAAPLPSGRELFTSGWFMVISLETLLNGIAMAFLFLSLTKERLELRQHNAAMLDPLTGIANRRAFLDRTTRYLKQRTKTLEPVAMILFDLDRFKSVNDRYGQAVGDRVLQLFCVIAGERLRGSDIFGRLGGEEFAVLMPGVEAGVAVVTAERIRKAFAAALAQLEQPALRVTVSAGVATSAEPMCRFENLIKVADRALYMAKAYGRNRVEIGEMPETMAGPGIAPDLPAPLPSYLRAREPVQH